MDDKEEWIELVNALDRAVHMRDRYKRERDELLAALQWFHPRPGVWRTPDDAKAEEIEMLLAQATS